MGIIEILLISIGLSFDVFVVHICVGAGFSRKHGKDTLLSSLLFGGAQLLALILGNHHIAEFSESCGNTVNHLFLCN